MTDFVLDESYNRSTILLIFNDNCFGKTEYRIGIKVGIPRFCQHTYKVDQLISKDGCNRIDVIYIIKNYFNNYKVWYNLHNTCNVPPRFRRRQAWVYQSEECFS